MFFKKRKQEDEPAALLVKTSSTITKGSKFEGNITTSDCVEINGEFIGNINCKKEVFVKEFGQILGEIKADKVINEGKIEGKIISHTFQSGKKSFTKNNIEAKDVTIDGMFDGVIKCETLHIGESGDVKKIVQAKSIEISGKIDGDIACESLATTMHANVKGKLFVNKLLNNGGTIDGFIGKYQEILKQKVEIPKESKKIKIVEEKKLFPKSA